MIEDYFVPALWQVGDKWFKREIDVAQEKVCSTTAAYVLDAIATKLPVVAPSRTVVGATFTPSKDTLASKIIGIALRSINIRPLDLGPSVEPEVIAEAAVLFAAEQVWISHTHVTDNELLIAQHHKLRELLPAHIPVAIGGGALSPALRRSLSGCHYYESILAFTQSLEKQKAQ